MNPSLLATGPRRGRALVGVLAGAASLVAVIAAAASGISQARPDEPRTIEILVKRYAFEPAEIEVTEGERVRLSVKSGDGLHGFEIKQFRISKEIPRGTTPVMIEFTANAAGRFPILCSIYCGEGHDAMKGMLVVTARAAQP